MLKTLHLQNFKAFANQQIALPALTVFTGVNGVGKSSFIQSLILLRQSYLNKDLPQRLILNHEKYVELGKMVLKPEWLKSAVRGGLLCLLAYSLSCGLH